MFLWRGEWTPDVSHFLKMMILRTRVIFLQSPRLLAPKIRSWEWKYTRLRMPKGRRMHFSDAFLVKCMGNRFFVLMQLLF